jgi:hypothetical protein
MQGVEQNPKLGYYKVGDQIFYSKPEAFIYATETDRWPEWKFNIETYARLDWTQEPETNIRELYRMRAQQLRDKYDYIRLECSGGSDSTTVAFSFLLNNIHLDEVIFRYPKTGDKGVAGDPFDTKATNTLSEFDFAARPLLNWIKTNFPKTVVRIHDFAENMLEEENTRDESWVFHTRDWFQPAHADKYNQFSIREHRELADSGKKIAVISGIEKPRMCIIDNKWYVYFADVHANSAHPIIGDYTNITNEYFYWTPDFPEIINKQVHLIKQWFDMDQNSHLYNLLQWPNNSISQRTAYEQIVKSIIYPDYDMETWQTSKPTNSFYNEMDNWFYINFRDTNLYQAWEAGLQLLTDKIDSKYFLYELEKPVGLKQMFSPHYYVGDSTARAPTPAFKNRDYRTSFQGTTMLVKDKKITRYKF